MRSNLFLMILFSMVSVGHAECLSRYAAAAEARAHRKAGWPVAAGMVFGGGLIAGEPLIGASVAAVGMALHTMARIDRHIEIQPVVLLVQARRGTGKKLRSVAADFHVTPDLFAGVVRDLDLRDEFCRSGMMNENQMLERIAFELGKGV